MLKKRTVSVLLGLAMAICIFSAGCSFGGKDSKSQKTESDTKSESDMRNLFSDPETRMKVGEIQQYIDKYFYFDVDEEKQKEAIFRAVLSGLDDPYSEYYTAEEFTRMTEDMSGTYVGIGAVVTQDVDGIISVVRPIKNSPAEEAGLQAGDILVQVDDMEIQDQDLQEVVTKIRGQNNTEAYLKVIREGEKDYLEFHIKRREVENYSVDYEMLEGNIGYVQVTEFLDKTFDEFKEAVDDLTSQGAEGFILDLRDNPGGLVNIASDMVAYFADETKSKDGVIISTEGKDGTLMDQYKDTDGHKVDLPVVILANKNSASASEIFSGSMRDLTGAKLVGVTTYGKGIMQSVIRLSDGSGMKITVAKYFIPSGYDLHKVGLVPDYEVELPDKRQNAVNLDRKDDTQLDKAIEVLKEEMH